MKISETVASILLSSDGQTILETVGLSVEPWRWLDVEVAESEDLGLWIRVEKSGTLEL